jgi:coenzyme Q-binding protein COQ10
MSKLIKRTFFFKAELLSNKVILPINKSPIACYNAVADMNNYPKFVPWMRKVSLKKISDTKCDCDMTIGFPPITQSYISHVTLSYPAKIISISNSNAVFETLESVWEFYPDKKSLQAEGTEVKVDSCDAHYYVKFRFASPIYQNLTNVVFNMVFNETSKAFVKRIHSLNNVECYYNKETKAYRVINN